MDDESYTEPKINAMVVEICNDLEDLREALITALQSYEKDLSRAIGHIPVWTKIQEEDIQRLFEIPEIEDAILGPRSVAIVAQSIEEHVQNWLGFPDEIIAKKFDERDIQAYRNNCAEVESELLELSHCARRVTSEATKKLGEDLDIIMHRLDEERERDEDALKELVVDGSVERGDSARLEIADLWERYRSHAESLNSVWDDLESLAFLGMDMVVAGIEDIRWIMRQSDDALTLINPELSPTYEVFDIPIRDQARATFEIPRELGANEKEETEGGARETIEIDRHHAEVQEKKDEEIPEVVETFTELSEISEVVADEFWASRTFFIPKNLPFLEAAIWTIPLLALIGLGVTFATNPEVIKTLHIANLPIIAGIVLIFLVLLPLLRKWNFSPLPKRQIKESEELKIEIGDQVKFGDTNVDATDFTLQRWADDESAHFGWQLSMNQYVIVGMETNLTRWQSSNCDIILRDTHGWRLTKSEFRTLCRALSISLKK